MLRYQSGDAGAFDQLYSRHKGGLYRFIRRQCAEPDLADEVFQEVWMSLIQALDRYRPEAQFRTYLFTLAHHRLMDQFRRRGRGLSLVAPPADEGDSQTCEPAGSRVDEPEVQAAARASGEAILAALEALPPPQREAFLLHEEAGLSVDEIATATGSSYETAKSRLRYAIGKLRSALREHM
jgi:RNA polymerase sigma-70 factor (ECF subfamily)